MVATPTGHPGIVFRQGPAGRRAGLRAGPDVWEIVRDVRATRAAEPALSRSELVEVVESNTGADERMIEMALAYWADRPAEIEVLLEHADRAERDVGGGTQMIFDVRDVLDVLQRQWDSRP